MHKHYMRSTQIPKPLVLHKLRTNNLKTDITHNKQNQKQNIDIKHTKS